MEGRRKGKPQTVLVDVIKCKICILEKKKDIKKVQKQRVLELVGHWTPGFQPYLLGTDCMLRELE